MTKQTSIEPSTRFTTWMKRAQRAGNPLVEAGALATSDRRGRASVRFILLKHADSDGFVFYGDQRSVKGRELGDNPYAALAFYWDVIGKQVRIEGPVEEVTPAEADAYWATRPRASQLSASASVQSAGLSSRADLQSRVAALRRSFARRNIPRPSYWTGFRIRPEKIEFWTRGSARLHRRELFVRTNQGWKRRLLQP